MDGILKILTFFCFRIGFRYWKDPGPFVQYHNIPGTTGRFVGWWSVVSQAAFSFIGTEIVAVSTTCRGFLRGAQVEGTI